MLGLLQSGSAAASATVPVSWRHRGPTIVGDADDDAMGNSVALSANARILAIGSPGAYNKDEKRGYVKVFRADDDDSGNWTQLGQTVHGNATGDLFGWAVDITADGSTIVIGSPRFYEDNYLPGFVQVFSLEADDFAISGISTWAQVGQNIFAEANGDEFGYSVSISDDGEIIAIGADTNDGKNGTDSGHVRIYALGNDGTSWEQLGEDIDGDMADDLSGYAVSLSSNGTILAIGAPRGGVNGLWSGQVKVYRMNSAGSSWERLGQTIYGDNARDWFGSSVDISPDGSTIAVGAAGQLLDRTGYVRVFSLDRYGDASTDSWLQIGQDIVGEAVGDQFGWSVSISDNGGTLAVGAGTNDGMNGEDSGNARIYQLNEDSASWEQMGMDIDGDLAYDLLGYSVSLSASGTSFATGSPRAGVNELYTGQVKVYTTGIFVLNANMVSSEHINPCSLVLLDNDPHFTAVVIRCVFLVISVRVYFHVR
jgi:hypothetical protein